MYSYQSSTAKKRYESLVPKRKATLQLVDKRPKSLIQRKLQTMPENTVDTTSKVIQLGKSKRPGFTDESKKSAILYNNTIRKNKLKIKLNTPGLTTLNLAQPHRISWKDIRDHIEDVSNGGDIKHLEKIVKVFRKAGNKRIDLISNAYKRSKNRGDKKSAKTRRELLRYAKKSQKKFNEAYKAFKSAKNSKTQRKLEIQANSFHGNVPDYGTHQGVNNVVGASVHLNLRRSRSRTRKYSDDPRPYSPSPMSRGILKDIDPKRLSSGIAVTNSGKIITTSGSAVDPKSLRPELYKKFKKFDHRVIPKFDKNNKFGKKQVKN